MQYFLNVLIQDIINSLPSLIGAILILVIGIFIASKLKNWTVKLLQKFRLNQMLKSLGWEDFFNHYNAQINVSKLLAEVVNIFFILLFLTISLDILGLEQVNVFIQKIIDYFPNIFIAIAIFLCAVFLADFSKKVLVITLEKEKIVYSSVLSNIISSAAWILATLAILYQLKIVPDLVLTIFIGFVAFIVLAFGLAFGLGGRDFAKKILDDLEKKIK
ncbi:MAG TPA: hypothetical protein PLV95_01805 [Candidatus Pacearchaeota archaeon]|nr:hypothetical protein [Candidatus Pacearchaeota archaeon]